MKDKNPVLVKLGQNIKKLRLEKGISQEELALQAGLHRNYIGAVERGENNISVLKLVKITKVLGVQAGLIIKDV
jgi:transcriptional regulator with XRE-family HTH domain